VRFRFAPSGYNLIRRKGFSGDIPPALSVKMRLVTPQFDSAVYGPEVENILSLDGGGQRLAPLAGGTCSSAEAKKQLSARRAEDLFPGAVHPVAAMSGLWLYFSCFDESHAISQDIDDTDGSFWHGILHRREPDAGNAAYWFRSVGAHPVFPALRKAAEEIGHSGGVTFPLKQDWDPFQFIEFCESARSRPGSAEELAAKEIQRIEWQLLFDHCARKRR
jgi:hypothetical protein